MIYDDIIIENSLNNLIKDQGDIIKEQYQNQIDILNTIIEFQSCDDLNVIKEEFKETIKNKIKEIIKKFIEWCKQLKTKIDLFMAKYMKNFNFLEKKYIELYKKEIKPITNDNKLSNDDKLLKITNVLKRNNFATMKDFSDNRLLKNKLIGHVSSSVNKSFIGNTIEDDIKDINKQIIELQDEIIKELHIKADFDNVSKARRNNIDVSAAMKSIVENIEREKEYNGTIKGILYAVNFEPKYIVPYDGISMLEKMIKNYHNTTKEVINTTDEFLRKLENELQKNDNSRYLDTKDLSSLINSINSYKTNIINTYTKYLIHKSKTIYNSIHFYINEEIYENMKNN